ncbi:MAG: NUDIX domain-containing protein [Bacillota bacterium]|uniref:NUDIX domain-containing protein n=1 Tax=Virgibacillus salarius TaxID=447199 RepID=A0A941IBD5_9BACI|nr:MULTISPECIES: NUDIX domain-containing protein [Virgibacillus]NAZ09000.1 NUDIX domain-containing protein [Agaribacter marinus]MBR7796292.1 NUDIX domain-containing protein [Virgibacillus salarius]MCC2248524.1 NUDIX domain-containing protein [Virgibacillus sp. AGTR]QRZ16615.1 NUDIX domain-containing protein [Virgibacillus sp. AGTR]WBX79877.1 NUDIX domain-containing protein [Virgibacillus salarius]
MGIRNSAKAIIIHEGEILTIMKQDRDGYYYLLPGGGQNKGENLHQALKREVLEEISAVVEIGELLCIREYIGKNHEHATYDGDTHQIEYMFIASLEGDRSQVMNGVLPDDGQIDVAWLPISSIENYRLYPKALRPYLIEYMAEVKPPVYLGDVN